jgi:hypothetical protein
MSIFNSNDQFLYIGGVGFSVKIEISYTYSSGESLIKDKLFRIYPYSLDPRLNISGYAEVYFNDITGVLEDFGQGIDYTLLDNFTESNISNIPIYLNIVQVIYNVETGVTTYKQIPNNIVKQAYIDYKILDCGIFFKLDGDAFFSEYLMNFIWSGKRNLPIRPYYHNAASTKQLNTLTLTATIITDETTLRFNNNQKTITYNGSLFTECRDGRQYSDINFVGIGKCHYIDPNNLDIVLINIDNVVNDEDSDVRIEYSLTFNNQTIISVGDARQLKRNLITGVNTITPTSLSLPFNAYQKRSIQIKQSVGHSILLSFISGLLINDSIYIIDSYGHIKESYNNIPTSITILNEENNDEEIAILFYKSTVASTINFEVIYI